VVDALSWVVDDIHREEIDLAVIYRHYWHDAEMIQEEEQKDQELKSIIREGYCQLLILFGFLNCYRNSTQHQWGAILE